jgi:hypothetical protein
VVEGFRVPVGKMVWIFGIERSDAGGNGIGDGLEDLWSKRWSWMIFMLGDREVMPHPAYAGEYDDGS